MKTITYRTTALFLLLFLNQRLFAQEGFIIDSVSFCSLTMAVPDTCVAKTKHSVAGKDWSIEWSYHNKGRYPSTKRPYVGFMKAVGYKVKEKKAQFLIHNKQVQGSILTFIDDDKESYSIYVSMPVNKQIMILLLSLNHYPVNNSSLPGFVKKIIQFKQ
ncbi:hypothetical protein [Niabella aurantiaca]|uniref:hypothetical protein n=1 Tax=Niabella aurantiaca TaxID=379900 RepID=UPI0012F71FE4|nr:hypothetical protein [Niabella aurantiaca]